ncbi:hypothetical protein CB0940_08874 [Cercospora beticola]|uniref:Uncharacterized protein n=1 Tax=Cercospora beticola TaxID=122368 RepID=A0A2G5HPY8_CERBT|nr:hypothetical protein CB0940_08874 [Cercospora beticola]PIA94590.1 hypothetical protein CB0940_08874 [Cercospora beticola]WPB05465.1 hypothetical protein RHO25_010117 [Cercospora beticola]
MHTELFCATTFLEQARTRQADNMSPLSGSTADNDVEMMDSRGGELEEGPRPSLTAKNLRLFLRRQNGDEDEMDDDEEEEHEDGDKNKAQLPENQKWDLSRLETMRFAESRAFCREAINHYWGDDWEEKMPAHLKPKKGPIDRISTELIPLEFVKWPGSMHTAMAYFASRIDFDRAMAVFEEWSEKRESKSISLLGLTSCVVWKEYYDIFGRVEFQGVSGYGSDTERKEDLVDDEEETLDGEEDAEMQEEEANGLKAGWTATFAHR